MESWRGFAAVRSAHHDFALDDQGSVDTLSSACVADRYQTCVRTAPDPLRATYAARALA